MLLQIDPYLIKLSLQQQYDALTLTTSHCYEELVVMTIESVNPDVESAIKKGFIKLPLIQRRCVVMKI